tara:strand:- start:133 stop:678 length:546 start_codon:yes stop_codon:yes gene_type:complete
MIKERNVRIPEELMNISKWDILRAVMPKLTKEKAQTQLKNYSRLKPDHMLFMCIDTIVNMFLIMCWDDDRKNTDNQYVKTRTFRQLIKNKVEDYEDIQKEYDDLVEEKGFIQEKEHNEMVKELRKENKRLQEENDKHSARLKQQEEYYKEKLNAVEDRVRAKLELEFKCRETTLRTPPEPS